MTAPAIIAVAITGSLPSKADNPAVPITVSEQIESTHAAFEAGATLVHIHVRDDAGKSSSDRARFAAVQAGICRHCPGMIIQFSTGGRGREPAERGVMLDLAPDMASLATGSVNFPTAIYENPPALVTELAAAMRQHQIKPEIEVFDLAMFYNALAMEKRGELASPLHLQFVLGIPNALPARREILDFLLAERERLAPNSTWTAAGIGRHQLELNHWSLALGGHCRTGLEDNVRFDAQRLAASNAELVGRVADLTADYGRHPATVTEARALLHLRPAAY